MTFFDRIAMDRDINNTFIRKFKSAFSSLFNFLLSASSFQLPMQTPLHDHHHKPRPPLLHPHQFSLPGLKTLVFFSKYQKQKQENEPRLISRVVNGITKSMSFTPSSISSTSSSSSSYPLCSPRSGCIVDDWIGTESGVCLTSNTEEIEIEIEKKSLPNQPHYEYEYYQKQKQKQTHRSETKKQFPPPIPFLGEGAQYGTQPPWVLTRHYTDGRLILKLERVKRHQSLESHRENGRLVLKLGPTRVINYSSEEEEEENLDLLDDEDLQFIEAEERKEETREEKKIEIMVDYSESEDEDEDEVEEDKDSGTNSEMEMAATFKSFTYNGDGCRLDKIFYNQKSMRSVDQNHQYFGSAPLRLMGTVM